MISRLRTWSFRSQSRSRIRHPRRRRVVWSPVPAAVERLEDRTLLSGNVLVELVGGNVVITGDAQDNSVAISIVNGNVRLHGLSGTQINGSADPFILVPNGSTLNADVVAHLGAGSDTLIISPGITFGGRVHLDGGAGDDDIGLDSAALAGRLTIRTGEGDDGVNLVNLTAQDGVRVQNESGDLLVNVDGGSVAGEFSIHSGVGDADIVLDSVAVEHAAIIKTLRGTTNVAIIDGDFGDQLSILTGAGNDFVFIDPTTVDSTARVSLGTGVDSLVMEGTNQLRGATVVYGGDGGDSLRLANANNFSSTPQLRNIEVGSVLDSFINLRLNDPASGALPRASQFATAVINVLAPPLAIDVSANAAIQSNGTLLTDLTQFQIDGTTEAGATITIDVDGDGEFDDGTVVAAADGTFSIDVSLLAGPNPIHVRSISSGTGGARTLEVDVHRAVGTVVRFTTSLGTYDIELLDQEAPLTVANFLNYLARYGDDSIIHRSIDDFVIQGGGFVVDAAAAQLELDSVQTDAAIPSEFDPDNRNLRGTLSTALFGSNINSATSQWFINTVDNLFLDNVPHTVFGRVIGTGMEVVDEINETPTFNLNGVFPNSAFATVPLVDYTPFTGSLTGTVTVQPGSVLVTGTGTQFTTQLRASQGGSPGSAIRIGNQEFTVASIIDNTRITLNRAHPTGATSATVRVNQIPDEDSFVVFSSIAEIL